MDDGKSGLQPEVERLQLQGKIFRYRGMADLDAECPGPDALVPDPLKLHPFSTQEGHGGTRPRQPRIKFVTLCIPTSCVNSVEMEPTLNGLEPPSQYLLYIRSCSRVYKSCDVQYSALVGNCSGRDN